MIVPIKINTAQQYKWRGYNSSGQYKWVGHDSYGCVYYFSKKPKKNENIWPTMNTSLYIGRCVIGLPMYIRRLHDED